MFQEGHTSASNDEGAAWPSATEDNIQCARERALMLLFSESLNGHYCSIIRKKILQSAVTIAVMRSL